MYRSFYHFKERPFNLFADPKYLYLSSKHKDALAYLDYALTIQSGFIVITGDVGTGKTTLLKHVVRNLDDSLHVAMIFNTNITPLELLQMILREFDLDAFYKQKSQCYEALYDFLLAQFSQGKQCLLFIDEAQNLSPSAMEEIRMLSNLNEGDDTPFQIVLSGQPGLKLKLERKNMRQFAQRVSMDFVLKPLDRDEVKDYILHRMKVAGRQAEDSLFTDSAYERIYQASHGYPRLINILCEGALVYGYADELTTIDAPVIEGVLNDKKIGGHFFTDDAASEASKKKPVSEPVNPKLNAVTRRLESLEAQFKELKDNNHNEAIQRLEKLLAEEREHAEQAIRESAQKEITIKLLRQRVAQLTEQIKKQP
jgi:general secretion pathway protein A